MSGSSKVIVLDPDPRAGRQLTLGFERESVAAIAAEVPADVSQLAGLPLPISEASLVVVGGVDGTGVELVRRARALIDAAGADIPLMFAGRAAHRADLEDAGADEIMLQPAFLRDVVTIGRMLRGVPAKKRRHLNGSLVETTGVYTLVRALAALGRSAVLTLIRGLRRGEIRFFHGEVTSAQVGLIHGQAALHQLLLWTDARFDFHHEDIVRRQQIPLTADELFADAERFLEGVRESAGRLSPAVILDQDVARVQQLGAQVPTEVHGVLRMFDGHRVLADILEDSPYRVFETLRVTQRAVEAGLLRPIEGQKPKATWRAVLAIEEWLVGSETRDAVVERTAAAIESAPVNSGAVTGPVKKQGVGQGGGSSKKKRKKKRLNTPLPMKAVKPGEIDWGALVPRVVGAEVGPLAGVVPAAAQHGEIEVASTRAVPREKLETLDTGKRERIFPSDIGLEPKVVYDDSAARAAEQAAADAVAARAAEAAKVAEAARVDAERAATAIAAARADAERAAEAIAAAKVKADADAAKARADAEAARAKADADAATKAKADADAAAKAQADADAAAATAKAEAEVAAKAKAEADAKAKADAAAAKADADAAAKAKAEADAKARAEQNPVARARQDAAAAAKAQAAAKKAKKSEPRGVAPLEKGQRGAANKPTATATTGATATQTPAVTIAETSTTTVIVSETVTVADHATDADTATLVATQTTIITEAPPPPDAATSAIAIAATISATPGATPAAAAVSATIDNDQSGVVRDRIATVETDPLPRRARRTSGPPVSDEPPKMARGEIAGERPRRKTEDPDASQPSILIHDLATVHAAVSAAVSSHASASGPAPKHANAATPARERDVAALRGDATAFTDDEEAFFKAGSTTESVARVDDESFGDLDEGYQPLGFWDRVLGKRAPKRGAPGPRKK